MLPVIVITAAILIVSLRLLYVFSDKIKFYSTGLDAGFTFSEINTFWHLAKVTSLAEPLALYVSVPTLNRAITTYIAENRAEHTDTTARYQHFLGKLYKYRTKIDIEHENKRTLESTRYLSKGQRLRIILKGFGVFQSEIVKNEADIIAKLPVQKGIAKLKPEEWIQKDVSVYLWRRGDAGYVFDTSVRDAGIYNGYPAIYMRHTNTLLRTQKRRSVRASCNIVAGLYFLAGKDIDFNMVENMPGYKCLLEDISEDGALIRVGGMGRRNVQIKIQFELNGKLIVMFGIVRAVEYNKVHNQSRLHFECMHIANDMRNAVLSFVYNTLPPETQAVLEALTETEAEAAQDETAPKEAAAVMPRADETNETMDINSLAELNVEEHT